MKKNDWILIAVILCISGAFFGWHFLKPGEENAVVEISVNGELFAEYPLDEEQARVVEIEGMNKLVIQDGKAEMTWADCPDQICVHHTAISRAGESIICLPNKVVVSITGGEERELDAVTN